MEEDTVHFHEMGLDDRILKALADLGWSQPTLIQEKAIPLALEGKDLLARARTGSGKTAAYAIPLIQRILTSKQTVREQAIRALVLVPTKELGQQVQTMIRQLTAFCSRDVRVADISGKADISAQKPILMEKPDIVVSTPSRVQAHINAQNLQLQTSLEMLVIDEADLLFSFGFEADLKSLLCHLPKIYQAFLMSATLNDDVQALKELVLHNPVMLKLQGSQLPDSSQLQQYSVRCEEEDKFLLIYTLLKLGLVQGKSLVFVRDVDRCYRLKLFLEQFSIPACNMGPLSLQYLFSEGSHDSVLKPYGFKMEEIEGFRYRCRDAMRSVTKQAVKEARLKEIKQELLNSEKLKTYFEDNPRDLQLLRHDKDLHPAVIKPHLKNVPDYLIPTALKSLVNPLKRRKKKKNKAGGVMLSKYKFKNFKNE
uniref:RNA helicase n=1 Tax=Cyprinus carpio TaxID=7962 RepID=A0A8C1MMU3_CYPCA